MKVYLCSDFPSLISKSGVGRSLVHQKLSLDAHGIEYTLDSDDDFDIVQINTLFPQSVYKAIKYKLQNKPVIYFAHSTKEDFMNSFVGSNLLAPLFKTWLKFCYSQSDLILTPTQYSKDLLQGYGFKQPIEVMSNGIDVDYWNASQVEVSKYRSKLGLKPNDKMIMSVGLPIARKGIEDFVKLAMIYPEYKFFWFGELNSQLMPHNIKVLIENAPANVYFPGYISRDEMRLAYQACDLYLFLTHEETEGIVLLEALASKANVLVRDIPVFASYKDKEDLYKASSLEEFAAYIPKILQGSIPDLTENGYKQAEARSVFANGSRYYGIYQTLLYGKRNGATPALG